MESIAKDQEAKRIMEGNDNLRKFYNDLPNISEKIQTAGWKLMSDTGLYHITGLVSFLLAIFAFFCRPRWVGVIALPFGIYSINLAMVIM
jgi:hypothetical protein